MSICNNSNPNRMWMRELPFKPILLLKPFLLFYWHVSLFITCLTQRKSRLLSRFLRNLSLIKVAATSPPYGAPLHSPQRRCPMSLMRLLLVHVELIKSHTHSTWCLGSMNSKEPCRAVGPLQGHSVSENWLLTVTLHFFLTRVSL